MCPNQKLTYDKATDKVLLCNLDAKQDLSWRQGNLVFEDAEKSKEYLNKIIKMIASDSSNYLDMICNDKNENTINEFFEKLVNKRNLDKKKKKMDYSR